MSPSLEFLERCSSESGFQVPTLEKVVRLGELAADVARHPLLRNALALKGGTALNLGYGPPSRLSVDLDFNYVASVGREEMIADRPRVEDSAEDLARRSGYRVQRSRQMFAGRKLFLTYDSASGPEDRIELDLNFLYREPLMGTGIRELWQPDELDRPRVLSVSTTELCVGKVLALVDRAASRDAYDVGRLPVIAGGMIESPTFRAFLIAMSGTLAHPLHTYDLPRLERHLEQRDIEAHLIPMLMGGSRPSREELVDRAWAVLEPLVRLEDHEREYVDRLHAGDLRPELLFPDSPEQAARVGRHPAVLWKLQNVREYLRQGGE